jgi:parallel beta-helix repeat protein/predicted outer membrane repeat protein
MTRHLTRLVAGDPARRSAKGSPKRAARSKLPRLRFESLEERSVPAIFTVTNTSDNGGTNPAVGAGTGTFRQDANAAGSADTIVFDTAGVFATPQTINLETVLPTITSAGGALTITGTGVNNLTIQRLAAAATTFRVFTSTATGPANALTMTDFTVSGGRTTAGAGLNASGTVFLDRMRFSGNSTTGTASGGAIRINAGGNGFLSVKDTTISGNTAGGRGGGIYFFDSGSLVVENSTISGNTSAASGGGIYFYGTAAAGP